MAEFLAANAHLIFLLKLSCMMLLAGMLVGAIWSDIESIRKDRKRKQDHER